MNFVQKKHIITATIVASLALASCTTEDELTADDTMHRSELLVNASIAASGEVSDPHQSRSIVSGTSPFSNFTFGLFINKHNDDSDVLEPFSDNAVNWNIKATQSGNTKNNWVWAYANASSTTFSPLTLYSPDPENEHIDLYAYSPWKSGVTLEKGYVFNLASQTQGNSNNIEDVMYATYTGAGNLDKEIGEANLPLGIQFHHALSRININLRLKNPQQAGYDNWHYLCIRKIVLSRKSGAATPLNIVGSMNPITHELTPVKSFETTQQIEGVTLTDNNRNTYRGYTLTQLKNNNVHLIVDDNYRSYDMLVYPTEYLQDDDFELKFYFDSDYESEALVQSFPIKMSDITHSDGVTTGFKAGYTYKFYFTIDNFMRLSNIVISDEWETVGTEETEILI